MALEKVTDQELRRDLGEARVDMAELARDRFIRLKIDKAELVALRIFLDQTAKGLLDLNNALAAIINHLRTDDTKKLVQQTKPIFHELSARFDAIYSELSHQDAGVDIVNALDDMQEEFDAVKKLIFGHHEIDELDKSEFQRNLDVGMLAFSKAADALNNSKLDMLLHEA